MIVRGLDTDHDWLFGKGKNDYLSFNDAIEQNIDTRLLSFLGDCFFDTAAGLDWFNLLGSKDQIALELAVRSVIINTDGVTKIVDISVNLDSNTRQLRMQYTVETIYTNVNINSLISSSSFLLLTESGDVLTTEDGSGLGGG